MNLKFRKKPTVIEAFQLTKDHYMDRTNWPKWLLDAWEKEIFRNDNGILVISTLEGLHLVSWDDWIIQGIKGELYPCKPDVFNITYEVIQDDPQ